MKHKDLFIKSCNSCFYRDFEKEKREDPYCLNLCDSKDLPGYYVPIIACSKGRIVSRNRSYMLRKASTCSDYEPIEICFLEVF